MTLRKFQKDHFVIGIIYTLEGLAGLHLNQEQPDCAARLIGWADFMREKIGNHRPPVEQGDVNKIMATCRTKMGQIAFSDAYEVGKKMSLEVAITYALEEN